MNLYVVLGVSRDATLEQIKRAYRRLARKHHPDINPGDRQAAEVFRRISIAYETLSNPDERRRYDIGGDVAGEAAAPSFEFLGFDFSRSMESAASSTFGELFADALQARAGVLSGGPEPGPDLHASIALAFEDALRGTRAAVSATRLERCAPCGGLGRQAGPETACGHCEGRGRVTSVRGHMVFSRACHACAGTGITRHRVCAACGGEGVGPHTGSISVLVPAGIMDGAELVIPGEGHAGRRGGPAGALHLEVRVRPHPFFRREGIDLCVDVPLAIHEAALGARIDVPTIDGFARLRVPPGTQAGQQFRLRGRGVPTPDGRRGDLVATVRLVLPASLDERSRELLREFAMRNPGDRVRAWTPAEDPADASGAAPGAERGSAFGPRGQP
jgi:molecular chaperone DnaJ